MLRSFVFIFLAFVLIAGCGDDDSSSQQPPADQDGDLDLLESEADAGEQAADGDLILDGDAEGESAPDGDIEQETITDGDMEQEAEIQEQETNACVQALPLVCGDQLQGNTAVDGQADAWRGYSCSARLESGPEVIYSFISGEDCNVVLTLKDLSSDLDLFLLSACDSFSCIGFMSTPLDIQDEETVNFSAEAGKAYYVVVDGYADAEGTYTLQAACSCGTDGDMEGEAEQVESESIVDGDSESEAENDQEAMVDGDSDGMGLIWQDPPSDTTMTWSQANYYCQEQAQGGGGWRLPTVSEARSLIRGCATTETGGSCGVDDGCIEFSCWTESCGGTCEFMNGPDVGEDAGCYRPEEMSGVCGWSWTASSFEHEAEQKAWAVLYHYGWVDAGAKTRTFYVRCVKDPQ